MDNTIGSKLSRYESSTPSQWRQEAQWRQDNRTWLRTSQNVAIMMLQRMRDLGLTQKSLAERMGCTQQYISRILKGRENLSLETISKIENALDLTIFTFAAESQPEPEDKCLTNAASTSLLAPCGC